jgi:hypothetical protein
MYLQNMQDYVFQLQYRGKKGASLLGCIMHTVVVVLVAVVFLVVLLVVVAA